MEGNSQNTTLYFLPGQGSDSRIFDSIRIENPNYKIVHIAYDSLVNKNTSMEKLAMQLIDFIDTTKPFVLIGVSLGGMLCVEINEIIQAQKLILISSAQNRKELPLRYRFQRYVPLYALFPAKALHAGAKIAQPLVEPDRNKQKETFKSMLYAKKPSYIKQSIRMIMQWKRSENAHKAYVIHGTKDNTLPIRKIKNIDYTVNKGSHMMCLTRAAEISKIINEILAK